MSREESAWVRAGIHSAAGWICYLQQVVEFNTTALNIAFLVVLIPYVLLVEVARVVLARRAIYFRKKFPRFMTWYEGRVLEWWYTRGGLRQEESHTFTASAWYWVGLAIVYFGMPFSVTVPAVLTLAFGDPAAREVGLHFGRKKRTWLAGGTIAGCLGFFVAALLAIGLSVGIDAYVSGELYANRSLLSIGLAVFAGMIAERTTGNYDNLAIPVTAAAVLWIIP